jgi:hypothetical protein
LTKNPPFFIFNPSIPKSRVFPSRKKIKAESSSSIDLRSQFIARFYGQLARAPFLREITGSLKSCEGKLKHPGIIVPLAIPAFPRVKKSHTLWSFLNPDSRNCEPALQTLKILSSRPIISL